MVIKINGKPIKVEESKEKREVDVPRIGTLVIGLLSCAIAYDLTCSMFLFYHPFPLLYKVLSWFLGGL